MEPNYDFRDRIVDYVEFSPFINHFQRAKLIYLIQDSKRFDIDKEVGSYVFLKGTETPIGYIGDEELALCRLRNNKTYDVPRSHLLRIFKSVADIIHPFPAVVQLATADI